MPTKTKPLIHAMLDKTVVVLLRDLYTQSEDGELPMMLEGILYDYDEQFILLGNEDSTYFSLVNYDSIAKVDLISKEDLAALDAPSKRDMN